MIHKYTSVKEVIAKVYQDLDLNEDTHRVADMVQWAGEAMEKIGAFPTLVTKVAGKGDEPIVEFNNFQARLPYDVHTINQIAYSAQPDGNFEPMYLETSTLGLEDYNANNAVNQELITATSNVVFTAQSLYNLDYDEAVDFINLNEDKKGLINGLLVNGRMYPNYDFNGIDNKYKYVIQGQYLKLNVEEGYLMISYQAIPTDKEGYPEIPDLASFKEALYWYINMKILYPLWRMGKVRDGVYYDARRSWNFYCKQAYAESMMPNTAAERRAIMNTWVRLLPEIEEDEYFYKYLGDRQYLNLHN